MLPNRKALLQKLEDSDIQIQMCFAGNITRHPAYRQYYEVFPNTDEIMKNGFLVGVHHGMDQNDADYVNEVIKMHVHSSKSSSHIKE
jgi:CDP-6-deoxy-D-xylo-4-hexulose-3-dehydrase